MLENLLTELNNWFVRERLFRIFTITDGVLLIPEAQEGQYIRIMESTFNDGVYKYPVSGLQDETFNGVVWLLAIPNEVVKLADEIEKWETDYADVLRSPLSHESFAGYEYTKQTVTGGTNNDDKGISWSDIFSDRLKKWRKI